MRLVLHIGLGKTGTTAFQRWCGVNRRVLRENGYLYGSTFLQNIAPGLFGSMGDVARPPRLVDALSRLDAVLEDSEQNLHTLLWSNESFSMARQPERVIGALAKYVERSRIIDDWSVFVIFRRQDQWIESAYRQWGLKHKTYLGRRIITPEEYIHSVEYLLDYYSLVTNWRNAGADVRACPYDAAISAGGTAVYLARRIGLNVSDDRLRDPGMVHESLDNDLSMLMALYNRTFETRHDPRDFLQVLKASGLLQDRHESDSCFVSPNLRRSLLSRFSESNSRLERDYFTDGEKFNRDPVKEAPVYEADLKQLISRILPILAYQQNELQAQARRIEELERQARH